MKHVKRRPLLAFVLLFITLGSLTSAFAQITPRQDSYTDSSKPTTNFGTAATLGVSSSTSIQTAYIQFDLSSIPAGYTSANVAKATLKLYVNSVTKAGSFNVDFVNGSWAEKTITSSMAPALGNSIASSVPLTTASANNYVEIDVTSAVGDWLNGSQPNDGLALVANTGLSSTFDSKENSTQSHPGELDIVFASGLPNSCSANQILQWNGSAWVCATEDPGTITGVTAGTALTGGGTAGNVTLNLDTTKVPLLNAANAFTGNQMVTGTLSASTSNNTAVFGASTSPTGYGVVGQGPNFGVSGTGTTGVGVDGFSTSGYGVRGMTNAYRGVFGYSFDKIDGVQGVYGQTDSTSGGAQGVFGLANAASGSAQGVQGLSVSPVGTGVYGISVAASNSGAGLCCSGIWGSTNQTNNYAVLGTADSGPGGVFINNSNSGGYAALTGQNNNPTGYPFFAYNSATNGNCNVDFAGNLNCSGAKHAVVPIDGGKRKVALSAIESPVNWFEDAGSAHLANGAAVVQLDSDFVQTINTEMEYHVFPVPYGDCKGLYVTNQTARSFEVHELGGGTSNVPFHYRIMALRKNFENIRMEDHTSDPDPAEMIKAMKRGGSRAKVDLKSVVSQPKPFAATRPVAQKAVK